ncbi:MAG: imidazoleglycerol-phosphate dehydratase HisB [Clostridia bacterium]|nr:imidazoleglycerol-phosphate dehydratase HisB [Clostridia bacterium]
MRKSEITRKTNETDIKISLEIDGKGNYEISSGCGFLDHMLTLFARHGRFDVKIACMGDTFVDCHHTVEDIGICLGKAFAECIGDKKGIKRYGNSIIPMDESLILSAVDVSGRGECYIDADIPAEKVGDFDTELCEEFWYAFARNSGITLHIKQLSGKNSHHIIEGIFKSASRSLREALSIDKDFAVEIP